MPVNLTVRRKRARDRGSERERERERERASCRALPRKTSELFVATTQF